MPVWQPDVRTFEVTNAKTGELIGLFYLDTYGREGKRSGAWATGYRDPSGLLGNRRPGSNNNNFTKPEGGKPVLISLDDASTHSTNSAMRSRAADRRLLPVARRSQRDFVEYPSQVNENWLLTRPVLEKFARHYQTGEPMPARWSTRSRRRTRSTRASPRSNICRRRWST